MHTGADTNRAIIVPDWIPDEVKRYLAHTEHGRSIRCWGFDSDARRQVKSMA